MVSDQKTKSTIKDNKKDNKDEGFWRETIITIIQALLLALLIRSVLFQPFSIPSQSMVPTLLIGDYLIVSKYSYGYSRYSFPLSPPLFEGRIWETAPERGDVAVFRTPVDDDTDYIKRVIGLPGDKIQMIEGVLHINGEAVKRKIVSDPIKENQAFRIVQGYTIYQETLPNGVSYITYDAGFSRLDNTPIFHVPEGHYFMMGDNRDRSGEQPVTGSNYKMKYQLPEGISGNVVLLQWYWLTANSCKHEGYAEYPFPEEWGPEVFDDGLPDCENIPPDGDGVPEQVRGLFVFVCVLNVCVCCQAFHAFNYLSNLRLLFPTNFLFLQFWNCAEIRIVGSGSNSEEEEYIPELQEATTLVMEGVEVVVGW